MKSIIIVLLTVLNSTFATASTGQEFKFTFKSSATDHLEIKQKAPTKEAAFKLAAKECFNQLTCHNS